MLVFIRPALFKSEEVKLVLEDACDLREGDWSRPLLWRSIRLARTARRSCWGEVVSKGTG